MAGGALASLAGRIGGGSRRAESSEVVTESDVKPEADERRRGAAARRMLAPKALRTIDGDKRRKVNKTVTESMLLSMIKGAIGYAFFLLIFCYVAFSTRSATDYWANEAMRQLFVDGSFFFGSVTHEKTLHDVHFVPQFFDWLEGPFLATLHSPELGAPPRFLHGYNRIIGQVRLRQVRVRPNTCSIPSMFTGTVDVCYAPYSWSAEDTAPFGPPEAPLLWQHRSSDELDGFVANGRFGVYPGSGYVVDLPSNLTVTAEAIAGLRRQGWIDRATRAVFVDMSTFNANTATFTSVRLLFEFLPTGGIMPFPTLLVLRPLLYQSTADYVRALFEALFVAYTVFYVVQVRRAPAIAET